MKATYSVVKILKDAMTGEAVTPSLLIIKSAMLHAVKGETLFTGCKTAALHFISANQ